MLYVVQTRLPCGFTRKDRHISNMLPETDGKKALR